MKETIKIGLSDISHWCNQILGHWIQDEYIINSWIEIAINRDMISDFPRGTVRLESIIERIEKGLLTKRLDLTVEEITPISARVYSTFRNWPDEVARKGAEIAAQRAEIYGIGVITVPKPNIIGEVLRPILAANQIGMVITQNAPLLNLGVSKENLIGNNPIAICAPGNPPFLFDGSFGSYSRHSFVSLKEHADLNGMLPPGIVLDVKGEASQDVNILYKILEGDRTGGSFPPLGGIKGLGLAMGMEFIAGALSGGFFGITPGKPWGEGATVFAFNSKLFNAIDMLEQVQNYLSQFESYPGKNSNDIRSHVVSRGWIEYPRSVYESFCRVSAKTGINSDILGKFEEDSRPN